MYILPAVLTWLVENAHEGKDYAVSDFLTTWQGADSACTANDATDKFSDKLNYGNDTHMLLCKYYLLW